jgi:hypothetical protein
VAETTVAAKGNLFREWMIWTCRSLVDDWGPDQEDLVRLRREDVERHIQSNAVAAVKEKGEAFGGRRRKWMTVAPAGGLQTRGQNVIPRLYSGRKRTRTIVSRRTMTSRQTPTRWVICIRRGITSTVTRRGCRWKRRWG